MSTKLSLTGTARYWIREDKMLRNGSCPLFVIYSLYGERSYYDTGIKIFREQWDLETEQIKSLPLKIAKSVYNLDLKDTPTKEDAKDASDRLSKIIPAIRKIEQRFELDSIPFTSKDVVAQLRISKPPKTIKKKSIIAEKEPILSNKEKRYFIGMDNWTEYVPSFISKFCRDNQNISDINLRKKHKTLQSYLNVARDLIAYEKEKKVKPVFNNMNREFMVGFFDYVVNKNSNNNITGSKKISILKTVLKYATLDSYGYKLEVNRGYREYSVTRTDNRNEVVALTVDEYRAIATIDLEDASLRHARDIFIFACNTGLRISDLETLKKEHIANGVINKISHKTKERNLIPLSKTAKNILNRYQNDPQLLISMHRNHINKHIKEVAKLAGIDDQVEKVREYGKESKTITQSKFERMTNHIGRKSFITMMLAKGVSIPEVMALSGHKSMKAFQRYIDVSKEQREAAINKAFDDL